VTARFSWSHREIRAVIDRAYNENPGMSLRAAFVWRIVNAMNISREA
jgi:hypothetical protein